MGSPSFAHAPALWTGFPGVPGGSFRMGDCDCVSGLGLRAAPANSPPERLVPPRRRRIWDLGESLHCSIVGTCLSTDELRKLLRKLCPGSSDVSDHALHGIGVGLAGRQDRAAKLLNKTLDDRHRVAIRRFDAAADPAALRTLWRQAIEAGEIPGGYWAVLTHPATDQALVNETFGEVHMLSHLVGAANRADIRRLATQEHEIAELRDTVARQQARLRADLTERDGRIRALQNMLAARPAPTAPSAPDPASELQCLIAELHGRLQREADRREAAERRRAVAETRLADAIAAHKREACEIEALRREIAAVETVLGYAGNDPAGAAPGVVLYIGGRSGQTATLRRAAKQAGAELVHHDAEGGSALLPGLVGRAGLVVFPVDCVSHDAALAVKRLCRQLGRPFKPLRSTGTASLLAALRAPAAAAE